MYGVACNKLQGVFLMENAKNPPVTIRVLFPIENNSLEMVDFLSENGYNFEKGKEHFVFSTDNMVSAREAMFLFNHGVIA